MLFEILGRNAPDIKHRHKNKITSNVYSPEKNHLQYLITLSEWCHTFFLLEKLLIVIEVWLGWKYIVTDFNNPSYLKLLDVTGRIDNHAKSALQIWNNFSLLTRILFSGLTYFFQSVFLCSIAAVWPLEQMYEIFSQYHRKLNISVWRWWLYYFKRSHSFWRIDVFFCCLCFF